METQNVVPPAHFIDDVSRLIKNTLDRSEWSLSCEDIVLHTDEVSAKDGLLPVILWVAGQTLEKIWGPQQLMFRVDSEALCGMTPELEKPILPPSVWLHAIHFEIEQIVQKYPNQPAIIDDWFNRWNQALSQKKIMLLAPAAVQPSAQNQGGTGT